MINRIVFLVFIRCVMLVMSKKIYSIGPPSRIIQISINRTFRNAILSIAFIHVCICVSCKNVPSTVDTVNVNIVLSLIVNQPTSVEVLYLSQYAKLKCRRHNGMVSTT